MRVWRIVPALERINRDRARVGDFSNPPSRIVCPAGMKSRTFERLIARIEKQEALVEREFLRGLSKFTIK